MASPPFAESYARTPVIRAKRMGRLAARGLPASGSARTCGVIVDVSGGASSMTATRLAPVRELARPLLPSTPREQPTPVRLGREEATWPGRAARGVASARAAGTSCLRWRSRALSPAPRCCGRARCRRRSSCSPSWPGRASSSSRSGRHGPRIAAAARGRAKPHQGPERHPLHVFHRHVDAALLAGLQDPDDMGMGELLSHLLLSPERRPRRRGPPA